MPAPAPLPHREQVVRHQLLPPNAAASPVVVPSSVPAVLLPPPALKTVFYPATRKMPALNLSPPLKRLVIRPRPSPGKMNNTPEKSILPEGGQESGDVTGEKSKLHDDHAHHVQVQHQEEVQLAPAVIPRPVVAEYNKDEQGAPEIVEAASRIGHSESSGSGPSSCPTVDLHLRGSQGDEELLGKIEVDDAVVDYQGRDDHDDTAVLVGNDRRGSAGVTKLKRDVVADFEEEPQLLPVDEQNTASSSSTADERSIDGSDPLMKPVASGFHDAHVLRSPAQLLHVQDKNLGPVLRPAHHAPARPAEPPHSVAHTTKDTAACSSCTGAEREDDGHEWNKSESKPSCRVEFLNRPLQIAAGRGVPQCNISSTSSGTAIGRPRNQNASTSSSSTTRERAFSAGLTGGFRKLQLQRPPLLQPSSSSTFFRRTLGARPVPTSACSSAGAPKGLVATVGSGEPPPAGPAEQRAEGVEAATACRRAPVQLGLQCPAEVGLAEVMPSSTLQSARATSAAQLNVLTKKLPAFEPKTRIKNIAPAGHNLQKHFSPMGLPKASGTGAGNRTTRTTSTSDMIPSEVLPEAPAVTRAVTTLQGSKSAGRIQTREQLQAHQGATVPPHVEDEDHEVNNVLFSQLQRQRPLLLQNLSSAAFFGNLPRQVSRLSLPRAGSTASFLTADKRPQENVAQLLLPGFTAGTTPVDLHQRRFSLVPRPSAAFTIINDRGTAGAGSKCKQDHCYTKTLHNNSSTSSSSSSSQLLNAHLQLGTASVRPPGFAAAASPVSSGVPVGRLSHPAVPVSRGLLREDTTGPSPPPPSWTSRELLVPLQQQTMFFNMPNCIVPSSARRPTAGVLLAPQMTDKTKSLIGNKEDDEHDPPVCVNSKVSGPTSRLRTRSSSLQHMQREEDIHIPSGRAGGAPSFGGFHGRDEALRRRLSSELEEEDLIVHPVLEEASGSVEKVEMMEINPAVAALVPGAPGPADETAGDSINAMTTVCKGKDAPSGGVEESTVVFPTVSIPALAELGLSDPQLMSSDHDEAQPRQEKSWTTPSSCGPSVSEVAALLAAYGTSAPHLSTCQTNDSHAFPVRQPEGVPVPPRLHVAQHESPRRATRPEYRGAILAEEGEDVEPHEIRIASPAGCDIANLR